MPRGGLRDVTNAPLHQVQGPLGGVKAQRGNVQKRQPSVEAVTKAVASNAGANNSAQPHSIATGNTLHRVNSASNIPASLPTTSHPSKPGVSNHVSATTAAACANHRASTVSDASGQSNNRTTGLAQPVSSRLVTATGNSEVPSNLTQQWLRMEIGVNPTTGSTADPNEPQLAAEYANAIYGYLRKAENQKQLRADPTYLEKQAEISSRMRGILLDWLVEVHYKFKLVPETLYLCINLIDRLLDRDRNVPRKKLQLVGGTCMLIASKYEEFRPPEVGDICYIMDNAYTRDDILDMEVKILNTLKFEVTVPSALQFLEFFIKQLGIARDDDHFFLAQYLIEATLLEVKFLKYKPSEIAASCLYLANRIRKRQNPWPLPLRELTGYGEVDFVKPLAKEIFEMIPNFRNKSLFKKYSMEKYHAVAPTIPNQ